VERGEIGVRLGRWVAECFYTTLRKMLVCTINSSGEDLYFKVEGEISVSARLKKERVFKKVPGVQKLASAISKKRLQKG